MLAGVSGGAVRVTRDGLYLAFPFDSASNRWAESVMVEYANVVLKNPIAALLEHRNSACRIVSLWHGSTPADAGYGFRPGTQSAL